jgi:hypothetical protein
MKQAWRSPVSALAAVAAFSLACGLGGTPEQRANRQACEAWVAHMNTLTTCTGVSYDVDNICSDADDAPAEMVAYYDCLRESSGCDGLEPRLDIERCAVLQPTL